MQPLYFLPKLKWTREQTAATTKLILKDRGLAEVFSDVPHDKIGGQELAGRGPGDLSGSVIAYQTAKGEPPRRLGYYPNEQKWYPVGDGSLCWIGIDTAEPPTPTDLRRRKEHAGYPLELDNGDRYIIPVIRRPDGSTGLPTDMYLDGTGTLNEPIKAAYEKYWEAAKEPVSWFFGQTEEDSIDTARALQLAVDALSLNYRYTMQEQSVLRLIDKENYLTALLYSIDYPRVRSEMESQKKNLMLISSIEYRNWLAGRHPSYRPSWGDLFLAAGGYLDV